MREECIFRLQLIYRILYIQLGNLKLAIIMSITNVVNTLAIRRGMRNIQESYNIYINRVCQLSADNSKASQDGQSESLTHPY